MAITTLPPAPVPTDDPETFEYKVSSEEELIEKALADMKEHCYHKIDFGVEGYFDGEIGDTFLIESPKFTPQLNVKARIISKETSFTRPENSKTTFSNYIKLKSQVSDLIKQRLEAILESKLPYDMRCFGILTPLVLVTLFIKTMLTNGERTTPQKLTTNSSHYLTIYH